MERIERGKQKGYTPGQTPPASEETVAKRKEGEVAISFDVPKALHKLFEATYHELKLAEDVTLTKKGLIAEALAEGLPRVKERRLRRLKKPK